MDDIQKIGTPAQCVACSTTGSSVALSQKGRNVIVTNPDSTNLIFVNSGAAGMSALVFPTAGTPQAGKVLAYGTQTYELNSSNDTTLYFVSNAGTPNLYFSVGSGE